MQASDILLAAGRNTVAAFRKSDGESLWETPLLTGFFKPSGSYITLVLDETGVYAFTYNQLFRLELLTGRILWQKKTSSLTSTLSSMGVVSLALGGGTVSSASAAQGYISQKQSE